MRRTLAQFATIFAASLSLSLATGLKLADTWPPSSIQYTSGDYLGANGACPAEGRPRNPNNLTYFDPILNRLKNRDISPLNGPMTMKLTTILKKKTPHALEEAESSTKREDWGTDARKDVRNYENRFVQVEGFLAGADPQGPESCNCYSVTDVDFHLWLAPHKPSDFPSQKHVKHHSLVAEVSPRTLRWHPEWSIGAIRKLLMDETPVRITGWLMFDEEHPENLYPIEPGKGGAPDWNPGPVIKYKTRRTLWEIHPIHKIEVPDGQGGWKELSP